MKSDAATASRVSGLNWVDRWAAPLEGPLTIALKAVAANSGPPARTLRRLLKKPFATTTGLGLVGLVTGESLVGHEVGALIVSRSVAQLLPNLTDLATQVSLRICMHCLDEGALPYFLQFPVFKCCPVHGVPLLEACPSCGRANSPYRLAPIDLDVTLTCQACGRPFSQAWAAATYHLDWDPHQYVGEAHQRVHAALQAVNRSYRPLGWGRTGPWFADIEARDLQATVMSCAAQKVVPGSMIPVPDRAKTLALRTCSHWSRWEIRKNDTSLAQATEVYGVLRRVDSLIERAIKEVRADSRLSGAGCCLQHAGDSNELHRLAWADGLAREFWRQQMRQIAKDIQRQMPWLAMASWYPVDESLSIRPHFDSALPLSSREWGRVARWGLLCTIEAARSLYHPEHGLGEDCLAWLNYTRRRQAMAHGLLAGGNTAAFAWLNGQGCGTHLVCALPCLP